MQTHPAASARRLAVFVAAGCLFFGCTNPAASTGTTATSRSEILVPTTAPTVIGNGTGSVTVQPSQARQTIEGFGGSNAWTGLPSDATVRTTVVKRLFSTTEGAGLTLIRNRVPFREDVGNATHNGYDDGFMAKTDGAYTYTKNSDHKTFTLNWDNWDLKNTITLYRAAKAYSDDIQGFSTPWTPPNNSADQWKVDSGTNTVGGTYGTSGEFPSIGGVLSPDHYQDYADVLADYAKNFESRMGYPLAALSIQNEPNWLPKTYESCGWSDAQFHSFVPYLQSAWTAKGVTTPIMAPESYSFSEALLTSTLADASTARAIAIVATHQYSGSAAWLMASKKAGKRVWETEVSSGSTNDPSIVDGLAWAQTIHADLTTAEVNAFCYWWLWNTASSPTKSALISISGTTVTENKRLYTLGQYSRFVRPGWVRLLSETTPATNISTSVFKDPSSNQYAVVLINSGSSSAKVNVVFPTTPTSAELYRTSSTENLNDVGPITPAATVTVTLLAQSVSTVYGTLAP